MITKKFRNTKHKKHTKVQNKHKTHKYLSIFNHINKIEKYKSSNATKFQYIPKLKGGRYIDKGAFGCVVSPALPCPKSDENINNSVSKILKTYTKETTNEIIISNVLSNIDPEQAFFVYITSKCYIDDIPDNRTDIAKVKFTDNKYKNFNKIDTLEKQKQLDANYCVVDFTLENKPVNLIMPYAGISLYNIMKIDRNIKGKTPNILMMATMHNMFVNNFKTYFKHLIIGLIKMHKHRIANKDIKQKNIMLLFNKQITNGGISDVDGISGDNNIITATMSIRYNDFGLSQLLTSENSKDITSIIKLRGTLYFMAPELFICSKILEHNKQTYSYQHTKIMAQINTNVKKGLTNIGESKQLISLQSNIDKLCKKIKTLHNNERLLEAYYGTGNTKIFNGFLQKADVYSLGFTMFETLFRYSKIDIKQKNSDLYDLLLHMIAIDPYDRYNIIQCLNHKYFSN